MTIASSYMHSLEGRLRIKIPQMKGAAVEALEVERNLQHFSGVDYVSANPTTGNVLIFYNPRLIDQWQLISCLKELGYLSQSSPRAGGASTSAAPGIVEKATSTMTASLMEFALTRLVAALI